MVERDCVPEVDQDDVVAREMLFRDEDVLQLDVSVDDGLLAQVTESVEHGVGNQFR